MSMKCTPPVVGQFEIADLAVRTLEEIANLLDSSNDRTRGGRYDDNSAAEIGVRWKLRVDPLQCSISTWNLSGVTMAQRATKTALFAVKLLQNTKMIPFKLTHYLRLPFP